eukprot:SAG11_NODE_8817_length_973_cov_1.813501_2_plen_51_part_00
MLVPRYLARREGWYAEYSNAMMASVDMAADGTEDIRKQVRRIGAELLLQL